MRRFSTGISILLVWVLLGITFSACEENVNPFREEARYFTLFGALDMNADSQFVRVSPIRQEVDFDEGGPIDAVLTTFDLTDGSILPWTDSLFTFDDGSQGHVFFAPLRIQPGHTYRIEVERSDGIIASAETTVPALPVPVVDPVSDAGSLFITQSVRWLGVEYDPFNVETYYRFLTAPGAPFTDVAVEYDPANRSPDTANGWRIQVDLSSDKDKIIEVVPQPGNLTFMGIGMGITVLDDQFDPPGGRFDPEVLVQPGVFSNVENGFGFVGAMGRFTVEWIIPDDIVRNLGYVPPQQNP
ncbi:MAG: DUF4249 family protein [Rhodothermales bacterium]|nr:DUF4249 family protein [Rhodothermales bacterium]